MKVKEDDGIVKDIIQDEVLFGRAEEDLMIVSKTSTALNKYNILNISPLTENIIEVELEKRKIQDEITSLNIEMKKKKKVDDHLTPIRERILI